MQELKSSVATIGEGKDLASGSPEELQQIRANVNDLEKLTRCNSIYIRKRRMRWLGHVMRMSDDTSVRKALKYVHQPCQRPRGKL